jgi:signal transduction histidine kinase
MSSALSTRNEGDPDVEIEKDSYPQLLSLAVHEFRTPASVVGGYLRMLQRDTESTLSERQRKMVEEAEKSCARLVAIVGELSDVAKLDAGLIKLAQQPTDAFVLVAEVADLVHEARDRDVRFEARGQAGGATMSGDATRLRSAFDAIFRAILREKPGKCLVVAERRIEEIDGRSSAIVIVANEPSVQAAYDREPGPFDEKRGGMGLALPLARRVIEGHGGRVWAPAPLGAPREPGSAWNDDPLARGSAVICLPLTELSR